VTISFSRKTSLLGVSSEEKVLLSAARYHTLDHLETHFYTIWPVKNSKEDVNTKNLFGVIMEMGICF
jgi:hypothetical protein